jgi:hypothetical protein
VNGAVGDFVFKAKTGGVIVPSRQACTQHHHDFGTPACQAAETRFGVKLLDQAIDLSDAEFSDALKRTNAERASRKKEHTDIPAGEFIRKARGARPQNGLLIIYPIDPEKALVEKTDRPVISVVVSFPNSDLADKRVYRINSVAQKEEQ